MPYSTKIIDRGRGPEIEGTRVTVYDVLDYHTRGRHHAFIASLLGLSSAQVLAAVRYVEEHRDDVMPQYERIVERSKQAQIGEQERVEAARKRLMERRRNPVGSVQSIEGRKSATGEQSDARAAG